MPFLALPLSPERMADLDAVFQAKGCAVAKSCYCQYYRVTHRAYQQPRPQPMGLRNRQWMVALTQRVAPGLIGYLDGQPVAWVSLGPREDFSRLTSSPTMRRVDDLPVWSIVCFVVPPAHRRQGLAQAMLQAAVAWATQQGARLLEAYPNDRSVAGTDPAPWFGTLSMFEKAGFAEVARHRPARPIVRLALPASSVPAAPNA